MQSDSVDVDIPNSARMYFTVSPNGDDFYSWVELSYSEEFGEPVRFSGDSLHVLRGRLGSTDSWEIFTDIVDLRPGTTYYWRPMLRMFDQRIIEGAVGSFTTSGTPPVANRMPPDGGASPYGEGRLAALQMEDRSSGVAATRYGPTDRGEARGAR